MEMQAQRSTPPLGTMHGNRVSDPRTCGDKAKRVRAQRCPGASKIKPILNESERMRIGSWNVGTMTGRNWELEKIMKKRRIDIMCLQEVKWCNSGNKARFLNVHTKEYKMIYHGVENGRNGVGIVIAARFLDNVLQVNKVSDRLICIKLVLGTEIWNIVSAYAPQTGCQDSEKEAFWNDFDNLLQSIPPTELMEIGADLNGHVGESNTNYEECHGGKGYGMRNQAGEDVLDKCKLYSLIILNTMFIKASRHLVTYRSGNHQTQIDYHLCSKKMRNRAKDCKVILGEPLVSQHRLLLVEYFMDRKMRPDPVAAHIPKIKWNNLKADVGREFIGTMKEYLKDIIVLDEDQPQSPQQLWECFQEPCIERAQTLLGVSRGFRLKKHRETWWWNDETKEAVLEKTRAFKKLGKCDVNDDALRATLLSEYKNRKKKAKRVIAKAQAVATEGFYNELEEVTMTSAYRDQAADERRDQMMIDGPSIYKIAAQRKRNAMEITSPKFVEDSNGNLLCKNEDICKRWKEYGEIDLNQAFPRIVYHEVEKHQEEVPDFTEEEISTAVKQMKKRKATGPDQIPAEFWVELNGVGVQFLTILFNKVLRGEPMPDDFRDSFFLPFFKNKGDPRKCSNYRAIKLMPHTMKIFERVVCNRLRKIVKVSDEQCGFVEGKSTTDAIQALRIMMEKYREAEKDLYLVFIDLEKAFDRVPRDLNGMH